MHILMTDVLTCPRCGPRFGLILLADRIADRRVLDGRLGCSNCRETYAIRNGIGWFGDAPTPAGPADPAAPASAAQTPTGQAPTGQAPADEDGGGVDEGVIRLAALLGLGDGSGNVLLAGDAAAHAPALAALANGREILAVNPPDTVRSGPAGDAGDRSGVSVLRVAGNELPLSNGGMAGVAATGSAADAWLEECARLVAPLGRLLLDPAPADAGERLEAAGMQALAHEGGTMVAGRRTGFR